VLLIHPGHARPRGTAAKRNRGVRDQQAGRPGPPAHGSESTGPPHCMGLVGAQSTRCGRGRGACTLKGLRGGSDGCVIGIYDAISMRSLGLLREPPFCGLANEACIPPCAALPPPASPASDPRSSIPRRFSPKTQTKKTTTEFVTLAPPGPGHRDVVVRPATVTVTA